MVIYFLRIMVMTTIIIMIVFTSIMSKTMTVASSTPKIYDLVTFAPGNKAKLVGQVFWFVHQQFIILLSYKMTWNQFKIFFEAMLSIRGMECGECFYNISSSIIVSLHNLNWEEILKIIECSLIDLKSCSHKCN